MHTGFGVARFNPDGSLDSGFGVGGTVTTLLGDGRDSVVGVVLQADGKIIVGGASLQGPAASTTVLFALARYNPNGSLDTGFGTGGIVTAGSGRAQAIIQQRDGKILLAGSAQQSAGSSFALTRFNPDGSLDNSFGMGGEVFTQFGTGISATANGVIVQLDGKIVAAGSTLSSKGSGSFAVARYNPDGSLDMSSTLFDGPGAANAIALQSDGKAVVVGVGPSIGRIGFALVRYNPDGSLDAGFGTAGSVVTIFSGTEYPSPSALALQADGKILALGTSHTADELARYTSDGRLDVTFGAGGKLVTASHGANILSIQSDGKIVVAGANLTRYNADGSLDLSFGMGGMVSSDFGFSGLAVQPDAKLVVAGTLSAVGAFAAARYNRDGSLDTSFGVGGKVTTDLGLGPGFAAVTDLILQGDGRILVVGRFSVTTPLSPGIVLLRYNPDGSLDSTFGSGGKVLSGFDFSGPRGAAVQADGKILVATSNVFRFNTDGTIDTTFGTGGKADTGGFIVALQSDQKIIVASSGLARLNSNGSLDPTFGTAGMAGVGDFVGAVVIQPDGRIIAAGRAEGGGFKLTRYLADNVGTPNQRFVEQVYWNLLRRPVDPSGLGSWTGLLDQGLSRIQVATAIQSSAEYHALVVGDLYQLVLGRTVDPSGLAAWVTFLNQGGTAEQLEAILLGSDEFFALHGSDNSHGFLPALYQTVLQRPIDPNGAQTWGQALQSGASSRQGVATALLTSLESDRLEVQTLYMQFLHRPADPGGLDAFANALQQGVSNEQVGDVLMSSAEYFARV